MLTFISITLALTLPGIGAGAAGPVAPATSVVLAATTAAPPRAAAPATAPAKEKLPTFGPCEVKSGAMWRKATIVRRDGEWLVVKFEGFNDPMFHEWVEPWRVRAIGSKREIPFATPHGPGSRPSPKPGPAPAEEAPPAGGPAAPPVSPPATPAGADPGATAPAAASVRTIVLAAQTDPAWAYQPDPAPGVPVAPPGPIALTGATDEFFERVGALLFAGPDRSVAYVANLERAPAKTGPARVERLDLKAGTSSGVLDFGGLLPLAVSPDGKQMLLGEDTGDFGKNKRVELWALEPKPERKLAFEPYGAETGGDCDVRWAAFVGADHVLTLSGGNNLVLWKLPQLQPVYQVNLGLGSVPPILSPGAKFVALPCNQFVCLLDALQGKIVGRLPANVFAGCLAFSPDGKQLVTTTFHSARLQVWDLQTAKLAHDVFLPPKLSPGAVSFPAPGLVLVNHEALVDLPNGVVLWRYLGGPGDRDPGAADACAGRLWQVVRRSRGQGGPGPAARLVSRPVPDPDIRDAAAGLKPAFVHAVKPGSKVTLEVKLAEGDAAAVTAALTKKLLAHQCTLAPDQPLRLIATYPTGEAVTVPGRSGKADVTIRAATLQYVVNNIPAWEREYAGPADAWRFFLTVEIPAFVPYPRDPLGWGVTDLGK